MEEIYDRSCVWCMRCLEDRRANAQTCSSSCRSQLSRARTKFVSLLQNGIEEITWMLLIPTHVHQYFSSRAIDAFFEMDSFDQEPVENLFLQSAQSIESTDSPYQASFAWVMLYWSYCLFPETIQVRFQHAFYACISKSNRRQIR